MTPISPSMRPGSSRRCCQRSRSRGRSSSPGPTSGIWCANCAAAHGLEVIASDLYAYVEPLIPDIGLQDIWEIRSLQGFKFVITNLPYREQDELAARLVAIGVQDGCSIALLACAEWIVAGKHAAL
jgi:hypothetical protein